MKRLLFLALAIILVLSLGVNCLAASNKVTITDAKGGPGQTVYLTLELEESVEAAAIGIQCQYDTSLLLAMPELCTWERKGILSAFEKDNKGVWASEKPEDLKGKLCVLAFQIKEDVAFDQTEVSCTIVIKDGATEKVNTSVKGVISCQCTHSYGLWESANSTNHIRVCSLCGGKNTQTHDWDDGVEETQPNGQVLLVKTCSVCKARTATEVESAGQNQSDYGGSKDDHNHQTGPLPEHDHEGDAAGDGHTHTEGDRNPITLWVILLIPVLLIGAGIWFVKKK